MSHAPSDPHGDQHGHQADDQIDYAKVIAVGVVSLVIFALCTWWAAIILRHETAHVEEQTGAASRPLEIGKDEIGIVDQVPFIVDHRLQLWRAERTARLTGYGWVNRAKGIAHVPIESAMNAVAAGALPMGAPR
jgi:hypothetical protein